MLGTTFGTSMCFFFLKNPPPPEIYPLPLQTLSRSPLRQRLHEPDHARGRLLRPADHVGGDDHRSEEHTSELQSRPHLVCRLLLEKKKHTRHPLEENDLPTLHGAPSALLHQRRQVRC